MCHQTRVIGTGSGGGKIEVASESLLVAQRPSNIPVYLRDGSAQTILRATTLG